MCGRFVRGGASSDYAELLGLAKGEIDHPATRPVSARHLGRHRSDDQGGRPPRIAWMIQMQARPAPCFGLGHQVSTQGVSLHVTQHRIEVVVYLYGSDALRSPAFLRSEAVSS
jgi:hypothetical protein